MIQQIKQLIFDDEMIDKLADMVIKAQSSENVLLISLKKQLKDTQKAIDNILNVLEQGIILPSTKERLEKLEREKEELEFKILEEETEEPKLTKKQIKFWFERYRDLDTSKTENRRRLIDTFINSIYLYDDRILFIFNYKKGTKTISSKELEETKFSSIFTSLGSPKSIVNSGAFLLSNFFSDKTRESNSIVHLLRGTSKRDI